MKALITLALLVASPAVMSNTPPHPEAKVYKPTGNARADVDAALTRAKATKKRVILVMGANWCHDSKALSGWFETPRFKAMLAPKYELVYVDVGQKDRNIDIAQRFGIKAIKGTPTVLILSPDGELLNKKDAPTWRNAASRSADAVFGYFNSFGGERGNAEP
jgi:thiol-disulfide isomerase/thioredoxin